MSDTAKYVTWLFCFMVIIALTVVQCVQIDHRQNQLGRCRVTCSPYLVLDVSRKDTPQYCICSTDKGGETFKTLMTR